MTDKSISEHYAQDGLLDAIRQGIAAMGKTVETIAPEDLAPLDEFHVGGRAATEALLDQLGIAAGHHLLDVGCGIGGAARLAAHRYGARVTGIDATAGYVDAGNTLCGWLGMTERVGLQHGSALDLPFGDARFDAAWMLHVGMNIADKTALCREVHRVLKPGGTFGIYDIMRTGDGDIPFPVPWSTVAETSAVAPPADYRAALQAAGFDVIAERDRRDFALAFFEEARAKAAAAGGPPPLTIQLLMGAAGPQKFRNMVGAIRAGTIAPVEMIARKR
jgi:ubiquinone/menaquinone biosynthesis C-methylase UbiE